MRFSLRPAAKAFAKFPRTDVLMTRVSLRFASFGAGCKATSSREVELLEAAKSTAGVASAMTIAVKVFASSSAPS